MSIKDTILEELRELRREIHQHPEISGEERNTAAKLEQYIAQYNPDRVVRDIGGSGIVFVFEGQKDGPVVMVRAELDALSIQEINELPYSSKYPGKAHLCGHDGHMVMTAGLAGLFAESRPLSGTVALLFQPAEETGEGAGLIIEDDVFKEIAPDFIFALHNLPGFPKNEIVIKDDIFTSASKGLIISYKGKTSHAAEPENGISPALAIAETIKLIETLPSEIQNLSDFALTTVVHATFGEKAFGVTPGAGVVMTTIRAYRNDDLLKLENAIEAGVLKIANDHGLQMQISDTEKFSSTINDRSCCEVVRDAASQLGLSITEVDQPFRWSEDFGLFTQKYKGALFGLGSGEDTPDLHNPDYDFPDEITGTGTSMFYKIINKVLNSDNA